MNELFGRHVAVEDMLAARDARVARQQAMLARFGLPLISLTMNVPGPVKVTAAVAEGFDLAVSLVDAQLARYGLPALAFEQTRAFTGLEALWAVQGDADFIKRRMADIEEDGPFGRLLDIDIIQHNSMKASREDIGLPPRRCLLCGQDAAVCGRSRAHSADELFARVQAILTDTLDGRFADTIAARAQRALLLEVAITPKPGLVDQRNAGAHADMDIYTFLNSAAALGPYLRDCVRIAMAAPTPEAAFTALRYPGMRAEDAMLAATGGVNTHKGAIFSLGILCGAAGLARAGHGTADAAGLCELARAMTGDALRAEIAAIDGPAGARGEAAAGFPAALGVGLPALRAQLAAGWPLPQAGVYALVALMAQVMDANVARRGGIARARRLMAEAQALLADFSLEAVAQMDDRLMAEGLSPGGCADLLAVTLFLHLMEE